MVQHIELCVSKLKEANRETLSCHCSSAWRSATRWKRRRENRGQRNTFAYLDDVHYSSDIPDRPECGIVHPCGLVGMAELGPDVWNPDGVKVLVTPVGSRAFVDAVINKRLREEQKLWDAIPWVPDFQAAWQMLIQCSGPRCHRILPTIAIGRLRPTA